MMVFKKNILYINVGKSGKKVREHLRKLALEIEEDSFEDDLEMVRNCVLQIIKILLAYLTLCYSN